MERDCRATLTCPGASGRGRRGRHRSTGTGRRPGVALAAPEHKTAGIAHRSVRTVCDSLLFCVWIPGRGAVGPLERPFRDAYGREQRPF